MSSSALPPESAGRDPRDAAQVAHERAFTHVSDVVLNLEHTLACARKGRRIVARAGTEVNVELALADLIKDLERLVRRFEQDTYYAVEDRLV